MRVGAAARYCQAAVCHSAAMNGRLYAQRMRTFDPELPFEPKPSQRPLSSSNSHRKFRGERQTIGQTGPQELGQQRPLYTVFRTDSASFPASANADVKKADRRCASSAGESVQEVHLR